MGGWGPCARFNIGDPYLSSFSLRIIYYVAGSTIRASFLPWNVIACKVGSRLGINKTADLIQIERKEALFTSGHDSIFRTSELTLLIKISIIYKYHFFEYVPVVVLS